MKVFQNKKILVGVCGGIAAYKSCYLIRELIKAGAEVKVVMTPSACEFVAPLTFSTLSQNEVIVNIFPKEKNQNLKLSTWHIELGLWADLMIISPATVNTIAKINYGIADNALTTLALSLRCPLLIAPAADVDMYEDKATQKNISELKLRGVFFVEPDFGELASGLVGKGRLAEVDTILKEAEKILTNSFKDFINKKVLITAGPTYEPIDPVRFISNRSSGKMGHALALSSYFRGADVTVVTGPSKLNYPEQIKVIRVETAEEMYKQVMKHLKNQDIFISAAAVADFKPKHFSKKKIKKEDAKLVIELERNKDILLEASKIKKRNQKFVGFSLETNQIIENSLKKLKEKKLNLIIVNNPLEKGAGFEVDTNKVTIINKNGKVKPLPIMSKFDLATQILNEIKNC
ncbi:MAG: bifunctional phosphopantothenoylcysteine decarboxylase/phosphopantothenate--cysteine ligase CoaBC [Ignavibacteria bacterium]|nr:bifunctional phosphopantothenoylcysteine decarboxylase/phosphopantothenate--cysteine ligase CoaBC [Ignavibacteria bacterium]